MNKKNRKKWAILSAAILCVIGLLILQIIIPNTTTKRDQASAEPLVMETDIAIQPGKTIQPELTIQPAATTKTDTVVKSNTTQEPRASVMFPTSTPTKKSEGKDDAKRPAKITKPVKEKPMESTPAESEIVAPTKPSVHPPTVHSPEVTQKPSSSEVNVSIQPSFVPSIKPSESIATPPVSKKRTCTLTISCQDILQHRDELKEGVETILPTNGLILAKTTVVLGEDESAFDILKRICKEKNLALAYRYTPMFDSNYIEGINGIFEFDCGDTSGWIYRVNGKSPVQGCNQYTMENGDDIVFFYSCEPEVD